MARTIYLKSEDNHEISHRYESLSELKEELLKRNIQISPSASIGSESRIGNNVSIGSRSKIRADSRIGDNVSISDDVIVGSNVNIGANSKLRSNSYVASDSNIASGVLFKEDAEIGERCNIESNAVIGKKAFIGNDCKIGRETTIGSNCNLADKSKIGSYVNLGDNSYVAFEGHVYDNESHKPDSIIRAPIKPVNLIENEEVEIFKNLKDKDVRYVAFGSFACNAYEQARTGGSIKLWVDPSKENIERLNEALKISGKDQIVTSFDPEIKRPIKNSSDKSTAQSFGIDFYPSINGFKNEDFEKVYNRKEVILAKERNIVYASPDDQKNQPRINHLSLSDLFHNVGTTQSGSKEYSLNVLQKAMIDLNRQGQKREVLDPLLYLDENRMKMEPKKSYVSFSGQEDKPKEFVPRYEKRDFNQLRKDLDLELVLNHYGYSVSDKSKAGDMYRVYKSGIKDDSQRLAIMNKGDYKMFVDLNNNTFKGDSIEFVKFKEGDFKRAFPVMDSILGNPTYKENIADILPMKPATPGQFLNDEKLRQADILKNYNAAHLSEKSSGYLTNERMLDVKTIFSPEFKHQILSVKRDDANFSNTAFPLTSEKGNILSFDIRNKDYKALPNGGKWDGIWKTNGHAILLLDSNFTFKDKSISIERGTTGTLSKSAGKESFHIDHPTHGQITLPVDKDKHQFQKIATNRIIISESPIDSLSFHQLSPPKDGEFRQYISSAGNPSREQKAHIANLIAGNQEAQFVIGMDGNPPGNRFAINALAIHHPQRDVNNSIIPNITYYNPSNPTAEEKSSKEVGYNILKIEINHPKTNDQELARKSNNSVVDRLVDAMNRHQPDDSKKAIETSESRVLTEKPNTITSSYEIKFHNNGKMLGAALDHLTKEINLKDGKPLVAVIRPTSSQNDFNDVLRERKGVPLPESSNLSLSNVPFRLDLTPQKEQVKENTISSPTLSKEPIIASTLAEIPSKNKGFKI